MNLSFLSVCLCIESKPARIITHLVGTLYSRVDGGIAMISQKCIDGRQQLLLVVI